MNERLSPKYVPPTTSPTMSGTLIPSCCAMPTATGVSAAIVPHDVPMLRDMKHDARKMPGRMNDSGRNRSAVLTVASTAPTALADAAKAPASTNIMSMSTMELLPAPFAKMLIRSFIVPFTVAMA